MKYAAFLFLAVSTALPSLAATLSVQVDKQGHYTVQGPVEGWAFQGSIEAPLGVALENAKGHDAIGDYTEIQITPHLQSQRHYTIRTYENVASVLFIEKSSGRSAGQLRFPIFSKFPTQNLEQLSYKRMEFAPTIRGSTGDAPWVFFAPSGAGFILSPADRFMVSNCFLANNQMSVGLEPQVQLGQKDVVEHQSLLTFGAGVNQAFERWGDVLVRKSGKHVPTNDADPIMNKIGYWTDNRASYWYNFDSKLGYEGTLTAIQKEFLEQGIQLGHMQLDSWWYPKGGDIYAKPFLPISWEQANYNHGIYVYEGAPELFADGLAHFQKSLGLPLATHARWIDPSSPYVDEYKMSSNVSIDPKYWDMIMKSLKSEGVEVYEQDWLNSKALPRLDRLNDGDAFLGEMAKAAERYGLGIQYCMPLARHFLQASRYGEVRTIRTSGDGFTRGGWNQFLYGARLASALGVWPWTDVFFSADRSNVLIATLSGAIVGVGDHLSPIENQGDYRPDYCGKSLHCHTLQADNLKRAIRADGVVVKPDTALVPTTESFVKLSGLAADSTAPMVSVAYTYTAEQATGQPAAAYVFAYAQTQQGQQTISLRPSEFKFTGDVFVYDYFSQKSYKLAAGDQLTVDANFGGSYYVIVPLAPNITWLGDLNLFAALGKKRIEFTDDGKVVVHFAAGETELRISVVLSHEELAKHLHVVGGAVSASRVAANTAITELALKRSPSIASNEASDVVIELQ